MDNKENKFMCLVETKATGTHSITVGKKSLSLRCNFPIKLELTREEYAVLKSNKYLEVKILQDIKIQEVKVIVKEVVNELPKTEEKEVVEVVEVKEESKLVEVKEESKLVEVPLDNVKEQKEEIVKKVNGNYNDKTKNKKHK